MSSAETTWAAQYVRMSTEHQRYSIEYQTIANEAYALEHGYSLVRTYTDSGISGLTLKGRDALKSLLADVLSGQADFSIILVYDVSRWGRFQDPDQSAHYEFLCKEAGIRIEYCAEPFANDGSLTTAILKGLKRAMAAEFSRELSQKVSRSKGVLRAKGFWQGGRPGLGLRRQSLHFDGRPRLVLQHGERNGVHGARVTLVPGPKEEVELVRRIFRDFLSGLRPGEIARRLNEAGVPSSNGGRWRHSTVKNILRDEKYVGNYVSGRLQTNLGVSRPAPKASWLRADGAFQPLISRSLFDGVQQQFRVHLPKATDEQMLLELKALLARKGKLSGSVIQADPATHCSATFVERFGGLMQAYKLIGYQPTRQQILARERIRLHQPERYRTFQMSASRSDSEE